MQVPEKYSIPKKVLTFKTITSMPITVLVSLKALLSELSTSPLTIRLNTDNYDIYKLDSMGISKPSKKIH